MDIDEWEILSDDGFLDFNEDDENQIFIGKKNSESKSVFDNYFCTSPRSRNHHHQGVVPNKLFHVPIQLEPRIAKTLDDVLVEENTKDHVFFKIKENEFVDMKMDSPRMKVEKEMLRIMECDKDDDGFNLWKWSLKGIGAICSFGVAAATICVLFYGNQHKNKLHQHHKIQFQIYTDGKRIKQVVQHATKLNEAISVAARDVPLSRAHTTYDGI
ncbi:unnamed protein product [Lupinus luteus]|uniref:DUF6821 domain-containing protein n=1 Tax=Lupinus luteus TaxID=3873 RepID=A0AAV1XLY3_LUPLU